MPRPSLALVADAGPAASLIDPLRLMLLERLDEPGSASTLARGLNLPRQRINYHLRQLEKEGLVELVEERRRGNCVERLVKATARSYLISPQLLGRLGRTPEEQQDRFSASYLLAAAGRLLHDVSRQMAGAKAARKRLATLTLETEIHFASAESRNAFAEELAAVIARLAAKYHKPDAPAGRTMHVTVGAYPALGKKATVEKGSES